MTYYTTQNCSCQFDTVSNFRKYARCYLIIMSHSASNTMLSSIGILYNLNYTHYTKYLIPPTQSITENMKQSILSVNNQILRYASEQYRCLLLNF